MGRDGFYWLEFGVIVIVFGNGCDNYRLPFDEVDAPTPMEDFRFPRANQAFKKRRNYAPNWLVVLLFGKGGANILVGG